MFMTIAADPFQSLKSTLPPEAKEDLEKGTGVLRCDIRTVTSCECRWMALDSLCLWKGEEAAEHDNVVEKTNVETSTAATELGGEMDRTV